MSFFQDRSTDWVRKEIKMKNSTLTKKRDLLDISGHCYDCISCKIRYIDTTPMPVFGYEKQDWHFITMEKGEKRLPDRVQR